MEDAPVKLIVKVEKRGRQRGEKRATKLVFLDGEFAKEIKQIKEERTEHFSCWRCQSEKTSRIHFLWSTSQGVKTLCNGCNGQLIGRRPKAPKGAPGGLKDVTATAAQPGAEAEEVGEDEAEVAEDEAGEEEEALPPRKEQRKKKRPKKTREDDLH